MPLSPGPHRRPADKTHMLSLPEAARRLDLHPATLRRWCVAGKIAHSKYPSGQVKIALDVVQQILLTPPHLRK